MKDRNLNENNQVIKNTPTKDSKTLEENNEIETNDNKIGNLFGKDEETLKTMQANDEGGTKEVNSLDNEKNRELIENLKNDRKLKTDTLEFVQIIIILNIGITIVLLIAYPIIYLITGKQIYSEKFLGFLTGSQLIVMPLAILQIITKHLFPNKKDNEK